MNQFCSIAQHSTSSWRWGSSSSRDSDPNPHSELHCAHTLNPPDQRTQKQNKTPSHNIVLPIYSLSVVAVSHLLAPLRNSIFNRTCPHPSSLIELSGGADSWSTLLGLAALRANSNSALPQLRHKGRDEAGKNSAGQSWAAFLHFFQICFFSWLDSII